MTVCVPAAAADVAGARRSITATLRREHLPDGLLQVGLAPARCDEHMRLPAPLRLHVCRTLKCSEPSSQQQCSKLPTSVRTTRALRADERGRERDHLRDFFFARVAVFGSPAAARFAAFLSESISARADSRCLWAALPRAFNIDCSRGILILPK